MKLIAALLACLTLVGCATSPPRSTDNLCDIFREKRSWYKDARKAAKRWQSDIAIIMAFIHQESRFVANAKPPRTKILGFIPGPRKSDAYGYSQAKKTTWGWYERDTGNWSANRNDFEDAADFVGWYNYQSAKSNGISTRDPYSLYLAYHEGHGGYKRGTYRNKPWLQKVANSVSQQASRYGKQLTQCEKRLKRSRWWVF